VQVTAFSTPMVPEWRWRIVNHAGETIEESRDTYATISAAVASGTRRLVRLNIVDTPAPPWSWRSAARARRNG
jgi:hypothetical protein